MHCHLSFVRGKQLLSQAIDVSFILYGYGIINVFTESTWYILHIIVNFSLQLHVLSFLHLYSYH